MEVPKTVADFIATCAEKVEYEKFQHDGGVKIRMRNTMQRTGFAVSLALDGNPEEKDLVELIDLYKACRERILAFHDAVNTGRNKTIKNFGVAS